MGKNREEEFCFIEMEKDIKETLRMILLMVRALAIGIMVADIKEIGLMAKWKAKGFYIS